MRVILHVSQYYDFVPVPPDVQVTKGDVDNGDVIPGVKDDTYKMRVPIPKASHTTIHLNEAELVEHIIYERCRPDGTGRVLTRRQAIAEFVQARHLPRHARAQWITGIDVHDEGPDAALMTARLAPHAVSEAQRVKACQDAGTHTVGQAPGAPDRCGSCGHIPAVARKRGFVGPHGAPNIPTGEHAAHLAAYSEKTTANDVRDHLLAHFNVKGTP